MASTTVAVDRLDSWKAIAGYLNCDVRTAIRWEKERRLPIHRIQAASGSRFAGVVNSMRGWTAAGDSSMRVRRFQQTPANPILPSTLGSLVKFPP